MSASATDTQTMPLIAGQTGPAGWSPIEYSLYTSDGTGHGNDVRWSIRLAAEGSLISRRVWLDHEEWDPDKRDRRDA